MFGRDNAIDPVEEAKKVLRASEARHHVSSTEFARTMMRDEPPAGAQAHVPAKPQPKPAATATTPAIDARLQRYKDGLAKQGKTLTPEQLAALERLGEAQKAMAQKVAKGAAWIPRIIVALVVLFIVRDMIPDIVSLAKSLLEPGAAGP